MALASVRPATPDDVDEIIRIQASTWRTAYAELVGEAALQRLSGSAARRAWTDAVGAGAGHHVLVAIEGGQTVGFCAAARGETEDTEDTADAYEAADQARIATLLVEPRWGRRGHGRRLLAAAFEALTRDGAARGMTWLPEADIASRSCYHRIGWDPDGLVRTLDAGDRELTEIQFTGPLRVEDRKPGPRPHEPR